VKGGTAVRAALPDREVAGKTGTTQAARDAWFVGFTADYVAGVWMGYDDNTPLSGVTGGGLPAEIWHESMLRVHDGIPPRPLPMIRPSAVPQDTNPGQQAPFRDFSGTAAPSPQRGNVAERVLNDVLGAILGRN
jgi:membrane peptidoglycan carboxypeptidase